MNFYLIKPEIKIVKSGGAITRDEDKMKLTLQKTQKKRANIVFILTVFSLTTICPYTREEVVYRKQAKAKKTLTSQ